MPSTWPLRWRSPRWCRRYLLRSADFDTEGLIYASSAFHWKGDGRGTRWWQPGREYDRFGLSGICPCTQWRWPTDDKLHIAGAVERYAQVYDNLKVHDRDYPTPGYLRSVIREGNVQFDSDISVSGDSPGSNLIKQVLLDNEGGPVYLMAWGGPSTIARALKSIQLEYQGTRRWRAIQRKVTRKAIIVSFGTQDYSYRDYISVSWPDIQLWQAATTTWGYFARNVVLPEHAQYLSTEWTQENVSSVGPFGEFYRVWGDGKQMVEGDIFDFFHLSGLTQQQLREMGYVAWMPPQAKGSFISEGDTSTFLMLVDNGLRSHEHPGWGGWGGRLAQSPEDPSEWSSAGVADRDPQGNTPPDYAAQRWFGAAQRDFAARMQWSVTPRFEAANHHPNVAVGGRLDRTARPGEIVTLNAKATDPDGDATDVQVVAVPGGGHLPRSGELLEHRLGTIEPASPGRCRPRPDDPRDPGGDRQRVPRTDVLSARDHHRDAGAPVARGGVIVCGGVGARAGRGRSRCPRRGRRRSSIACEARRSALA